MLNRGWPSAPVSDERSLEHAEVRARTAALWRRSRRGARRIGRKATRARAVGMAPDSHSLTLPTGSARLALPSAPPQPPSYVLSSFTLGVFDALSLSMRCPSPSVRAARPLRAARAAGASRLRAAIVSEVFEISGTLTPACGTRAPGSPRTGARCARSKGARRENRARARIDRAREQSAARTQVHIGRLPAPPCAALSHLCLCPPCCILRPVPAAPARAQSNAPSTLC